MAYSNIDDFDPLPKVTVRVAQTYEENREAREWFAMATMKQGGKWDDWTNDDFIALCEEPEMLAEMTPLERELIARLAGAWEMVEERESALTNIGDRRLTSRSAAT